MEFFRKGLQWVGGKGFPPKQLGYEENDNANEKQQ